MLTGMAACADAKGLVLSGFLSPTGAPSPVVVMRAKPNIKKAKPVVIAGRTTNDARNSGDP